MTQWAGTISFVGSTVAYEQDKIGGGVLIISSICNPGYIVANGSAFSSVAVASSAPLHAETQPYALCVLTSRVYSNSSNRGARSGPQCGTRIIVAPPSWPPNTLQSTARQTGCNLLSAGD